MTAYPQPRPHPPAEFTAAATGTEPLPVVVIGAGPVGLTAALGLARRGVPVTIVEAGASASAGSRAICLSRHTLEVFDRMGAAASFDNGGLPWTGGRSFYGDREVLSFTMPNSDHDVRPPMVNLSQTEAEEFLLDAVAEVPGVRILWRTALTGLDQQGDEVELELTTEGAVRRLRARWVIAADGARSASRDLLGLTLSGTSYEGRYVIADIHWPTDLPTERLVWFDPPSNPDSTIIMHRQPHDIWRIDYQLCPDEDADAAVADQAVHARIGRHMEWLGDPTPWTLEWKSIYRAHALSLARYVHGRVIFAGDAAHLVPIFGVRGLNSGIEDAETLAWQLAAVVQGWAEPGLLAAYDAERRSAWQQNIAAASKSTRIMTPGSAGYTTTRNAVLSLAVTTPSFRPLVNPRQSSPTHARVSPLSALGADLAHGLTTASLGAAGPGDPVPDRSSGETSLNHACGTGFALVGRPPCPGKALAAAARTLAAALPGEEVRAVVLGETLPDADDAIAASLGLAPGQVAVVRPEGLLLTRYPAVPDTAALEQLVTGLRTGGPATTAAAGTAPGALADFASAGGSAAEPLPDTALEAGWKLLSEAIDRAGPQDTLGLLTRLALLLADSVPADSFAEALSDSLAAGSHPAEPDRQPDNHHER